MTSFSADGSQAINTLNIFEFAPVHTFDHEVIDGYGGVFEMLVDKIDRILFTPQIRLTKLLRLLVLRFFQKVFDISTSAGQNPINLIHRVRLVPSTVPRQLPRAVLGGQKLMAQVTDPA